MTKDELIAEWIEEWVRDNYGDSEAEEPSWNIWELAGYLKEKLEEKENEDGNQN